MRSLSILLPAFLVLCALLAITQARLDGHLPFTVGLPEESPSRLEVEGLQTQIPCGAGNLELQARSARTGHEDVLSFRLGPSTFIALEDVEATYIQNGECLWRAQSAEARIEKSALVLRGNVVVEREPEGEVTLAEWHVDLRTGGVTSR